MLSTDWSTIIMVITCFAAVIVAAMAVWKADNAEEVAFEAARYCEANNKRSISLAKLAEMRGELTDLHDAYDALMASHKTLRSRVGMREVRDKRKNGADADEATDLGPLPMDDEAKTAYKVGLRAEARKQGHKL